MVTDKIKVAVRVRPFSKRGKKSKIIAYILQFLAKNRINFDELLVWFYFAILVIGAQINIKLCITPKNINWKQRLKKSNFFLIYARKLKNKFETFFENESKITIIEILDLATLEQKDLMNDFLFKLQASLFLVLWLDSNFLFWFSYKMRQFSNTVVFQSAK